MSTADSERSNEMQIDAPAGSGAKADDASWVRIVSNDGYSYLVRRKVALASGTLRNMLDPNNAYAETNTLICNLDERGIVVEKLVEYMAFKTYHESCSSKDDIPVNEFLERIPPEIVLELLLAADYQEM